jgi:antitoxin component YwqK of YwqJK toxin-antitoxin module
MGLEKEVIPMKRIGMIILAGMMAMTLMACGQKDVENTVTTLAPTEPAASSQPTEPTVSQEPVTPPIPARPENVKSQISQHRYTYDEAGRILEDIHLQDGKEIDRTTYRFDSKGELTECTAYRDGKEFSRNVLVRDEAGNLLEQTYYSEGVESVRDVNTYDEKGNVVDTKTYIDGELTSHNVYAYDDHGKGNQTLSECWYGSELLYRYIYKYHYNDQGVMTGHSCYEDVGEQILVNECYLDENGNEYLWIHYVDGKEAGRTESEYTADGKILRMTEYYLGEVSGLTEYSYENGKLSAETCTSYEDPEGNPGVFVVCTKYDANGDVVLELHTANGKESSNIAYVRDEDGHVIRETMFVNGVEDARWERTYNEVGNITGSDYYEKGELMERVVMFYNDQDEVSVKIHYEKDQEAERWENTYDKHGNLIEEIYSLVTKE